MVEQRFGQDMTSTFAPEWHPVGGLDLGQMAEVVLDEVGWGFARYR